MKRRKKLGRSNTKAKPMRARIEVLESRIAPSVTGTVMVSGGDTRVELSGDNGNDNYVIGVSKAGNLTHTFPTGTGAGQFASNEDFDSATAGVQTVPAGMNTFVNIADTAGKDKLDFSGLPGPVDIRSGKPLSSASSSSGGFTFTGIEIFVGTDKNDTIRVNPGQGETFTVLAGDGDDTVIAAGDGDVSIEGGAGKDNIEANNKKGSATVLGGDGDDMITVRSHKAMVDGGKDNDTIIGKGDKDATATLDGGDGNDTIRGGKAKETILGGTGDDSLTGSGNDSLDGGDGKDDVNGVIGRNTVTGGAGNDAFVGGPGTTLIERGSGSFVLTDGKLTFDSGATSEVDTLSGISRVQLEGGAGVDKLDAATFTGFLTLTGGAGDDILIGGTGPATLEGGAGSDTITGNSTRDLFFAGFDQLPLSKILLTDVTLVNGLDSDVLAGIDSAELRIFDDRGRSIDASQVSAFGLTLVGGAGQDTFTGGARNDLLITNDGNDSVFLSAGKDKLVGGDGLDVVNGGALGGSLKVNVNGLRGVLAAKFASGGDKIKVRTSTSGVENFVGSAFDDTFVVTVPSKIDFALQGGDGNDKFTGAGGGGLFIFGEGGNDIAVARQSFGQVDGGAGDDKISTSSRVGIFLTGGTGKDLVVGGPGDDFFAVGDGEIDTVDGGAGKDKLISSDADDVIRNVP